MDHKKLELIEKRIIEIYNQMEYEMLINIAGSLRDNKNILETNPEAWKLQMLNNLGMLDRENLNVIKKHAKLTSAELNKILYESAVLEIKKDDDVLKKAFKKGAHLRVPENIANSITILSILESYAKQAANILNLTNQTLLEGAKQIYVDILDRAVADVLSGYWSGEQALRRAIRNWAEKGVPALVDRAGRKWGPEGYVRTVIRTTYGNVVNEMQDTRFDEWGVELIEVSSHIGARPLCAPYQGRIYSINPGHQRYPWIGDTSIGEPAGLFGINCGHVKYPYLEGYSLRTYYPYDVEENNLVYEESQRQRAIERSIRKAKTRENMYVKLGDLKGAREARQLVRRRQANMREFIKKTGRTRRYYREGIVVR